MFIRVINLGLICLIYSCNKNFVLPEIEEASAQFAFVLPDREELSAEVSTISDQMNAYRLSIQPSSSEESEYCDSIQLLKKYRDEKEIVVDIEPGCAYDVS